MTDDLSYLVDILRLPLELSLGVQFVGWAIAATCQTARHFDLFGSVTFFAVVISLPNPSAIPSLMVIAWCCRLGAFLSLRSLRHGEDPRFVGFLHDPVKQAAVWLLQGIWVVIWLLPVILCAHRDASTSISTSTSTSTSTTVPIALFLAGFALEVTADAQKWAFKSDPANTKQQTNTIRTGVWSSVKYPNYAGEIIVWLAIALAATADRPNTATELALSFLSPAFVAFLLLCVSGIPPQEAAAARRRKPGDDNDTRARLVPHVY